MKNVLLIGGGGTLGMYTAKDLSERGCKIDVIGLAENPFTDKNVTYYQMRATLEKLTAFLEGKHYDGIVDFICYGDAAKYPPFHALIASHTDHHIFLSSYRVYADEEHPITEASPKLLDVITEKEFLEKENYALPKTRCERYLAQSHYKNWTAVRPVISSSSFRLDLICESGHSLIQAAQNGKTVKLPASCRYLTAGVDWAGNTGKLIARLLFRKEALCKSFTISSGQNLTWDTVAKYYADLLGVKYEWVTDEEYVAESILPRFGNDWIFRYDRKFDRAVDNSAVLQATGMTKEDFTPLYDGIAIELKKLGALK